jgi:DNA-binding Lrp family transcriptional regulator
MVTAFIFIQAKTGKDKELILELNRLDTVKNAQAVYGDYDIVTQVEAKNIDSLNNFILEKIRAMPNVSLTNTLLCL